MSVSSKYLSIFAEEGRELIQKLSQRFISIEERSTDRSVFESALRLAHTLKGSSKMVGLDNISKGAHQLEGLLKDYSAGTRPINNDEVTASFRFLDKMSQVLWLVAAGDADTAKATTLDFNPQAIEIPQSEEEAPPQAEKHEGPAKAPVDMLRVRTSRVDKIQDLLEDIIVQNWKVLEDMESLKSFLSRAGRTQPETLGGTHSYVGKEISELTEDLYRFGILLGEMQLSIMELRLVPLSRLFDDYKRLIRDLSNDLGKEIAIVVEGEDTEVDRSLLEGIQGPLTHLLRNAADHGLEFPEERVAAGKPKRGQITLRAYRKPGSVVVEVEDDGRGIDADFIRKIALKKKFITEEEARNMSDQEAYYLLCKSGFTSREKASEVSGRGIGLDAVKVRMEILRGSLSIHSRKGSFSLFRLFLPQTLSTLRTIVVRSGQVVAAFPTLFVDKCMKVTPEDLASTGGEYYFEDVRHVPVSLAALFGQPTAPMTRPMHLVLLKFRKRRMLVAVDRVESEQELVVKSLDQSLQSYTCVLGVSLSADGRPIPILDVNELYNRWSGFEVSCALTPPLPKRSLSVLVVDDAVTSRHVESSILEEMGHSVVQAQDGQEALHILDKHSFDLIVTDMDMPRIDGVELVRRVRGIERIKAIPVVMISAQTSDEAVDKGFEAGINAYITKDRLNGAVFKRTLKQLFPDL